MPYLQLELLNSFGHSQDLLLQGCLISLEIAQLLVKTLRFSRLIAIMSINFFSYAMELVSKSFPGILALHSKDTLQGFFLRSQDLNLFPVHVQVFS